MNWFGLNSQKCFPPSDLLLYYNTLVGIGAIGLLTTQSEMLMRKKKGEREVTFTFFFFFFNLSRMGFVQIVYCVFVITTKWLQLFFLLYGNHRLQLRIIY